MASTIAPLHVQCEEWEGIHNSPSESECRPFIEKALKEISHDHPDEPKGSPEEEALKTEDALSNISEESGPPVAIESSIAEGTEQSAETSAQEEGVTGETESLEETASEDVSVKGSENPETEQSKEESETPSQENQSTEETLPEETQQDTTESIENASTENQSVEGNAETVETSAETQEATGESEPSDPTAQEETAQEESTEATTGEESVEIKSEEEPQGAEAEEKSGEETLQGGEDNVESQEQAAEESTETKDKEEQGGEVSGEESVEAPANDEDSTKEEASQEVETPEKSEEGAQPEVSEEESAQPSEEAKDVSGEEGESRAKREAPQEDSGEATKEETSEEAKPEEVEAPSAEEPSSETSQETADKATDSEVAEAQSEEAVATDSGKTEEQASKEVEGETKEDVQEQPEVLKETESTEESEEGNEQEQPLTEDAPDEEDLTLAIEIPEKLRPREHIRQILKLGQSNEETESVLGKTIDVTLRELKKLYDTAIKPLEILYKYRDLSNRHFGDPEIFSKPLVLFMGPWSGGKSTIINYLLDNEFKTSALRTGAEPSPAYFNIVMWGDREEVLDGTQLAADWTFSGLQKFGQGLLDRLRGLRLKHPLLEKVNIVEIPGILEIRKQVERLFPFNDACQWFIDRADIIFLVYDPSKLDVGPETEAILDQLKGREYQTRIILNKADQVRPEELMRVQGTLIWNISPLMSSTEPPIMYSTSLWSIPYEIGAPTRLLYAQEKAFLKDLRDAVEKRVENKIASARRFAVRVRNHAKMVDCYLTTYYNHKSFFGNKKKISDDIIEHPQNYHIYEGLSTLTNISRYDLPDPDVYRDFFRLNPVYEFQQLAATCTYFKGCPINRLDVAIAYDLPELVGKYKKTAEEVLEKAKLNENS